MARARILLKLDRAAIFRRHPFTIILKDRTADDSAIHEHRIKIDPGSKTTGIAIVQGETGKVVAAAEIKHRGMVIKASLEARAALRRNRRARKTRYRQPRFDNRTRPKGWLPPSLESRVANVLTWVARLCRLCPITAASQELVKFDLQKVENPEIAGIEYQQGTLAGYELREYLLEKHDSARAPTATRPTFRSRSSTSSHGAGAGPTGSQTSPWRARRATAARATDRSRTS